MDREDIKELGEVDENGIYMLNIIGEIEGHENLPQSSKTTKYEHVIPRLAQIEEDKKVKGVLFIINSQGGDVAAGLAIAEMISSLSKPTVSLVIGDSHSISVPLAVASDYSFIVPSATMIIHPVRLNGTVIGARQTYDYFKIIEDRILTFIEAHSKVSKVRLSQLMTNTQMLAKDLGTILVGSQAVDEGLICELGGIDKAIRKMHEMIEKSL